MRWLLILLLVIPVAAFEVPASEDIPDESITQQYVIEHWLMCNQSWHLAEDPNIVFGVWAWPNLDSWRAAVVGEQITCRSHCQKSQQAAYDAANEKYKLYQERKNGWMYCETDRTQNHSAQ